jgi:hypothetical protein
MKLSKQIIATLLVLSMVLITMPVFAEEVAERVVDNGDVVVTGSCKINSFRVFGRSMRQMIASLQYAKEKPRGEIPGVLLRYSEFILANV